MNFDNVRSKVQINSFIIELLHYLVVSPELFPFITEFDVIEFDPLLSDVHCRLNIELSILSIDSNLNDKGDPTCGSVKPKRWVSEQSNQFIDKVESKLDLTLLIDRLNSLDNNSISFAEELNDIVLSVNHIYIKSAEETFGTAKIGDRRHKNVKISEQPWFTDACREKRKDFHEAKKIHNSQHNENSRRQLKAASKSYRSEMDKSHSEYQFKLENEMRNMYRSDPSELWKILNKLNGSRDRGIDIPINELYDYFKNINSDANDDVTGHVFIPDTIDEFNNDILNDEISEDEILSAAKNLKNGKAAGYDMVTNEYIKSSLHLLLPFYKIFFNKILDTGVFPEIWTLGMILPVYKNKGDRLNPDNYRGITLVSSVGKLFTAVLNARLTKLADYIELIPSVQAGFRKGYSTLDNIFV